MGTRENSLENKFQNAPVTTSELQFVSEGTAVWELKNWSDPNSFEVLKNHANCLVELTDGRSFCFYLKEQKINIDGSRPGYLAECTHDFDCVSLFVKEFVREPQLQKYYCEKGFNLKVAVRHLNDEMQPEEGPAGYNGFYYRQTDWTSVSVSFEGGRKIAVERPVIKEFIQLSCKNIPNPAYYGTNKAAMAESESTHNKHQQIFPKPANLRYGITVQLLSCDAPPATDSLEKAELPIFEDFQWMYGQEDNHSDLKLESKDGMLISAHKFVLAARSSKFRELIEEQTKRNDFSGTIKIGDVDAKPLMAILNWMYTGKLDDNQLGLVGGGDGSILEEFMNACGNYELVDLLKLCEKKMITVCNPKNMLNLFQLARKYGMMDAAKEISVFIKENIEGAISLMQI